MKDLAIQKAFLQLLETTSPESKNYYPLRRLFSDYLTKLNVAHFDTCCPSELPIFPLRYNDGVLEYFDGTTWTEYPTSVDIESLISEDSGNQLVDDNGLYLAQTIWEVETLAQLAALDPTLYQKVIVTNVGIFEHSVAALTANDYSIVTGTTGFWVLSNKSTATQTQQQGLPILAKINPGVVSGSIEVNTKNGAMTTAVITNVGGYDNYAVTGGDGTSYIYFNNAYVADNFVTVRAKIRVDTVGASAPLLGIGMKGFTTISAGTSGAWNRGFYVNLLTKAVIRQSETSTTPTSTISSAGTLCSNGDVLEITTWYDGRSTTRQANFTVHNLTTGETLNSYHGGSSRAMAYNNQVLVLTMADITCTVIEYEAISSVAKNPLICVTGDSYGCGYNLAQSTNFIPLLKATLPSHDILCTGGNGAYINDMVKYQLPDILKLRPRYVLLLDIIILFLGHFDDGNANQTIFDNSMEQFMKAIIGYGGVPILIKWQTAGGFINGNSAAWDTKVSGLLASYPTTLILDLSAEALQLNANGHPTVADNYKIIKKLVALLIAQGAI